MDSGLLHEKNLGIESFSEFRLREKSDRSEKDVKEFWQQCLEEIKSLVPPPIFSAWIQPIHPVTFSDDTLVLRLPNRFIYQRLENEHRPTLEEVVQKVFGDDTRIEFVVASLPGEEAEEEVTPDIEVEITIPESSPSSQLPCDLNHRFQFSNFFVGVENELAKKAAMAVVETPDLGNFNPLVIYGGMGTGKTHLLHAIGNRVKEKDGAKNIILFNSDLFLNQYVFALQNNQLNNFISRLLSADWLLIDDIHLLSGKLKTQEGFLYIASLLLQRGKQIVVTTNISPGVMENFNPRLIAFLQSGLIVDIPPSEQATREQIIRYHFQENNIQPREEVVHFLAENLVRNLHDLHAVLVRIIAQISLLGKEMTLNDVRYILSRMCPQAYIGEQITPTFKQISIEDVVQACSEYFKIPTDILTGVTRKKRIIKARQITIYLCRELTQESLNSIGYHFSDIHHASVLYAYKKVEEAISKDPMIKNAVQSIRAKLIR